MSASLHQKSGLFAVLLLVASTIGYADAEPAASAPPPPTTAPAPSAPPPAAPPSPAPPPPATAEPPGEDAPAAPPGGAVEAQAPANVIVLVFVGGAPAPQGCVITSNTGVTATTTADGVARFTVPAGAHDLTLTVPADTLPNQAAPKQVPLGTLRADAGGNLQVLANLDQAGEVTSVDMEGQAEATEEAKAEAEAAPEAEVVLGTITGRIISDDKKEPIVDALVLVPGVATEVRTDAQGRFRIDVPVGTQSVSAIHSQFSTQTQRDVEVKANESTEVVLELTPVAAQLDDVVITAPHVKGGVASEMSKRRESVAVQDSLGSADIAKTGDGSASSASKRIVGASIVGGQFLFVRGLGGRYSNVRLNGVPLPSTDPDLPGFQLDLFPTSLLASLTIAKTFTPDIPGDFAGGSMNIETKAFPEELTLTLSLGSSYNTETTGRNMLRSSGGETDYLAQDDGSRALPGSVPDTRVTITTVRPGQEAPPDALTGEDVDEIGSTFPNTWGLRREKAYPNLSTTFSAGNTFDLGAAGRVGVLATGGYKYGFERYLQRIASVRLEGTGDDQEVTEREVLTREVGEVDVLLGGLGTLSYSPTDDHEVSLVSLLTRSGVDTASFVNGVSEEQGSGIERTQIRYVHRQLVFHQLLGEHRDLGEFLTVGWQLNTAEIRREQPDTRDIVYIENPTGAYEFRSVAGSGERLYSQLGQTDYGGGLDLRLQFSDAWAGKLGYMGRTSERSFSARRFSPDWRGAAEDRLLPIDELFDPEQSGERWRIVERTQPEDAFEASETLHAGYGMVEASVLEWLKAIGGARVEKFDATIVAETPYAEVTDREPKRGENHDTDILPAGSLIFGLSEAMNVRAAYGGTVARPQTRELAPFVNQDYVRRRTVIGNPDLKRTLIHNFDLRWELFPAPTEVLAVSLFYKVFEDPIERVVRDQNGNISFENIEGANNYGVEVEARIGLENLASALRDLSVLANLALIQSEVVLSDEQRRASTSQKRSLEGQSPYVANLGLGYEPEDSWFSAFAFYNVFGRRIDDVGRGGIPDAYEEPFHSVDANVNFEPIDHLSLSVSGSNLLFAPERYTQGGVSTSRVNRGATFSLGLGLEY